MKMFICSVLVISFSIGLNAQSKINAVEILKQAEAKRMPWSQMSFVASLVDSGISNSNSSYQVFFQNHKALVACLTPSSQKGNLLLLLNNEMWLYIHATQQPMKITPLQRLSGSVSFVDMARLEWTQDYTIEGYELVKLDMSKDAYLLHLRANGQAISYQKINLWIEKVSNRPIKEEVFLSSDKLYKTLLFTNYQNIWGKEINMEIAFIDYFNKGKKTLLQFSKPQIEKHLSADFFLKDKLPSVSKELSK